MNNDYLNRTLVIFFDGSITVPRNGDVSAGIVCYDVKDLQLKFPDKKSVKSKYTSSERIHTFTVKHKFGEDGFTDTTSLFAEHLALHHALNYADTSIFNKVIIFGDCENAVKQLRSEYKINPGMSYSSMAKENLELAREIAKTKLIKFYWCPREKNIADKYSR